MSGVYLLLSSIANDTLRVGECHVARGGAVALIVGNDFHLAMLEHSDTRVRGTQINTDCWSRVHCWSLVHFLR